MSMHMERPWLSLTGHRKGKKKFASAEQKRRTEELEAEWKSLKSRHGATNKTVTAKVSRGYSPPTVVRRDTGPRLPSLDTGVKGAVTVKQTPQYTGNEVIGISVIHKSCLQPIFTQQEAIDAAKMRR